jgi:hypothetical protein
MEYELKSHRRAVAAMGILALAAFGSVLPTSSAVAEPRLVGWAVVNRDGTLARFKGVTANFRRGPGNYEIVFNRNVRNCTYSVTPIIEARMPVLFQDSPTKPRSVQVVMVNPADDLNPGDSPFHLQVFCG